MTKKQIEDIIEENRVLKEKLANKDSLLRGLFMDKVTQSNTNIKKYTGIPNLATYENIYKIFETKHKLLKYWSGKEAAKTKLYEDGGRRKPGPQRKLTGLEEYTLTLVRLRTGMVASVLADLFGVSETRVSQIFNTWINFMSQVFQPLLKWPSKKTVKKICLIHLKNIQTQGQL